MLFLLLASYARIQPGFRPPAPFSLVALCFVRRNRNYSDFLDSIFRMSD